MTWSADLLTDVPTLSPEDCATAKQSILDLRSHWTQRHPVLPFYSLGATINFDFAFRLNSPYDSMARDLNGVLRENFAWLYERVAQVLGDTFDCRVDYAEWLALPGFHIFLHHPGFSDPKAVMHGEWFQMREDPSVLSTPIHCDFAQAIIDWRPAGDVDLSRPISFTLAIDLPASGAGMYVWDLYGEETEGLSDAAAREVLEQRKRHHHRYALGDMALHSGLRFHQVVPIKGMQPEDMRITFQGHGVPSGDRYLLYW